MGELERFRQKSAEPAVASFAVEEGIPRGGIIVYYDRRIWNYYDREKKQDITTIDKIRELVGGLVDSQNVCTMQPLEMDTSVDVLAMRLAEVVKEAPWVGIVIPERAKYETSDEFTVWDNVPKELFVELGRKYNVPIWQIDNGRIYPPATEIVEKQTEAERQPKYQENFKAAIKTESGKLIFVEHSSVFTVFSPTGTFTASERFRAIEKTFPDAELHKDILGSKPRFGIRIPVGTEGRTKAVWFVVSDSAFGSFGEYGSNPVFTSIKPDGTAEDFVLFGEYDAVLGMRELTPEPDLYLSLYDTRGQESPQALDIIKRKYPEFLGNLLGEDKIISLSLESRDFLPTGTRLSINTQDIVVDNSELKQILDCQSHWFRGKDESIQNNGPVLYGKTVAFMKSGQNETLRIDKSSIESKGEMMTFVKTRYFDNGLPLDQLELQIEDMRTV